MKLIFNKKGETLVEVVVAFSIMSFVLIGVSGLISNLIGLATESRTVTQATALAQKGLIEGVNVVRTSCDIREEDSSYWDGLNFNYDLGVGKPINSDGLTLTVVLRKLDSSEENVIDAGEQKYNLISNNGFRKVVSTVTWKDKAGTDKSYVLEQIVNK